ncbi:hypothetical protein FA13DRAFT_1736863 [Coprinellus micaceus]|uniref:Uncharacterized protein n=1 Tax=Coprinellus micaceus TaxID=71717 RepID=A0A4Y7SZL7_COPMI|nr:hypothetical protein FA13DRAFT_1736863 [Coprinellus micaceus]
MAAVPPPSLVFRLVQGVHGWRSSTPCHLRIQAVIAVQRRTDAPTRLEALARLFRVFLTSPGRQKSTPIQSGHVGSH